MKFKIDFFLPVLISIVLTSCDMSSTRQSTAPKEAKQEYIRVDFSSLEMFIELSKTEADTSDLEQLLKTKGFQGMINWQHQNWSRELDEDAYRNMLYAAFLPERYQLRDVEVYHDFAERIKWGREHPEVIEGFLQKLRPMLDQTDLFAMSSAYLPEEDFEPLNVYFIIGLNQGGASEEGNFIDPDFESTEDQIAEDIIPNIAHEAHHTFRGQLPEMTLEEEKLKYINYALFMLESEGFAQSVTHSQKDWDNYILEQTGKMEAGEEIPVRIQQYIKANETMKRFNDFLVKYFNDELDDQRAAIRPIFWSETDKWPSFHAVGQRMAYVIDSELGREKLISCLGKPPIFIKTYNEAAVKASEQGDVFVFDVAVIDSIQHLPWKTIMK